MQTNHDMAKVLSEELDARTAECQKVIGSNFPYGDVVTAMAGRMLAECRTHGSKVTFVLRRTYQDLCNESIATAREWDWVEKNGRLVWGHHSRQGGTQGDILARIAKHHHESVYHMDGIGLLMKVFDWKHVGAQLRALNIVLSIVEDTEYDSSGEVGSLVEVGHDRSGGYAWDSISSNGFYTDHLSQVQNADNHPFSRARPSDNQYMSEAHDRDNIMQDEHYALLASRGTDDGRIVKVNVMNGQLYQKSVLMQDVKRSSEEYQGDGRRVKWMSKLIDSKDRITVSPRKDRNAYHTVVHPWISDPTGFQVVMHRMVHDPDRYLPRTNKVMFRDDLMSLQLRKNNRMVHCVSRRIHTQYESARWLVMDYKGYKALWLTFGIGALHTRSGTCFSGVDHDWSFIGIHVTGSMANDVARRLGYRVDFVKNKRGHKVAKWSVPMRYQEGMAYKLTQVS